MSTSQEKKLPSNRTYTVDDIGSYIRTVYHMVSHTPKRGVGGSNPLMDASEQRRKPLFSRVFGFSYIKSYEKALSLYEIKFYSKI